MFRRDSIDGYSMPLQSARFFNTHAAGRLVRKFYQGQLDDDMKFDKAIIFASFYRGAIMS